MWRNVYDIIKKNYTSLEINIDGYVEQMKECNPNPILSAIVTDWDKASDAKLLRDKQDIIDNYQQKWMTHLMHYGSEDYERRKKIERIFFSYPQLADLVRILGREQQSQKEEPDNTILHYLPILLSPPIPAAEVEEIALGNNLQHLIPTTTRSTPMALNGPRTNTFSISTELKQREARSLRAFRKFPSPVPRRFPERSVPAAPGTVSGERGCFPPGHPGRRVLPSPGSRCR